MSRKPYVDVIAERNMLREKNKNLRAKLHKIEHTWDQMDEDITRLTAENLAYEKLFNSAEGDALTENASLKLKLEEAAEEYETLATLVDTLTALKDNLYGENTSLKKGIEERDDLIGALNIEVAKFKAGYEYEKEHGEKIQTYTQDALRSIMHHLAASYDAIEAQ